MKYLNELDPATNQNLLQAISIAREENVLLDYMGKICCLIAEDTQAQSLDTSFDVSIKDKKFKVEFRITEK